MIDTDKYEEQIEFDYVLNEIEVGVDISEGNYDILRYYRDEYKDLLAEVKRLYEMMDVLASFHIVKNVEQGFTQREWVELVELVKRGEEE